MKDIRLYFTESCPYCLPVKEYIEKEGLDVELIDATYDNKRKAEIIKYGGKIEVPMLYVDEKGIYDFKEIIKWLEENMK